MGRNKKRKISPALILMRLEFGFCLRGKTIFAHSTKVRLEKCGQDLRIKNRSLMVLLSCCQINQLVSCSS